MMPGSIDVHKDAALIHQNRTALRRISGLRLRGVSKIAVEL